MKIQELKEQLSRGTFYYCKPELWIQSKIEQVDIIENDYLMIRFNCGHADAFLKNVKTIKSPDNIDAKFKWCYILRNYDNECIGYIGQTE